MSPIEEELDNILFDLVEASASYTHVVTAEEADYLQSTASEASFRSYPSPLPYP